MNTYPTMHFRFHGSRTQQVLQQLFVFDQDDSWVLSMHALTDIDAEVFNNQPSHMVSEWLSTINHEWRNVPFLEVKKT